jgi:MFS family permease
VLLPVILFVIKDGPVYIGLKPYGLYKAGAKTGVSSNAEESGLTRSEAVRTSSFWILSLAGMLLTFCQGGLHVHTISFLSDIGYTAGFAAAVSSTYMIILTGCKVGMGYVFDRLGSLKASLLIGGCCALFPVFGLFAAIPFVPWIYVTFLGIASSGSSVLGSVLTANYFGRKDYSRVYSIISMFSYIGTAASAPFMGSIFDTTGSYTLALILMASTGVAVCVCLYAAYRTSKRIVFTG